MDLNRLPLGPDWHFPDSGDAPVITLERILKGDSLVRLVTHDNEEPYWQFLDGAHVFDDEAVVVLLGEMVQLDPTLTELADLPAGCYAWRAGPSSGWIRGTGEPPLELPPQV